jgi:hypothetical protein
LLRRGTERPCNRRTAKREYELSPFDVDCHVTLPRGSCPCNGGRLPRFDCAVCGYFTLRTTKI